MPKIVYNISAPYHNEDLFDLVADIESYPEFIPWCSASRIIKHQKDLIIAELAIRYNFFSSSYTSRVTLIPKKEIIVELVDGPFKYLQNHWKFIDNKNGSDIKFMLDFELKSSLLEKLVSNELDKYSTKLLDSFMKRAAEILQKTSN